MKKDPSLSILYIETYDNKGNLHCSGSGTLMRFLDNKKQPCHLIVTCFHVVNLSPNGIQLSNDIRVWRSLDAFRDETYHKAQVVAYGEPSQEDGDDLAFLETKDLERRAIDNYLFSKDIEKDRALCFYGFPLGRERIEKGSYIVESKKVETKIAKKPGKSIYFVDYYSDLIAVGVSGGGVFCRESQKLVGVWRGKWQGKRNDSLTEGVVIGVYCIHKLCEEYQLYTENDLLVTSPKESKIPGTANLKEVEEQAKSLVKEKVEEILAKKRLHCLKQSLQEHILKNRLAWQQVENPTPLLLECDLYDAIVKILTPAVKDSIEKIEEEESDVKKIQYVWEGAVDILGWIILLFTDPKWLCKKEKFKEALQNINISVPAETDIGVEVFFSSIVDSQAKIDVQAPGEWPCVGDRGKYCLSQPEEGWDIRDQVGAIKKIIWKQVYGEDPPLTFTSKSNTRLNETLRAYNDLKINYYWVANAPQKNLLKILAMLKEDLKFLNIILLEDGEKQIFIMPEDCLLSWLREFFKNKPTLE